MLKLPFFTIDIKKKVLPNLNLTFHSWSPLVFTLHINRILHSKVQSQHLKEKSHHTDDDMAAIFICNIINYASLFTDFVRREIFLEAVFL